MQRPTELCPGHMESRGCCSQLQADPTAINFFQMGDTKIQTGREKWPVPILVQENRVVLLYQSKNSPAYRDESWCVLGLGGLGSTYWQNLNQQWKVSDLSVMLCMTSDPTRELHSKQITGFWILFKKLSNSPLLTSKMLPNNMVPFLYLWLGFKNWHAARDGTVL